MLLLFLHSHATNSLIIHSCDSTAMVKRKLSNHNPKLYLTIWCKQHVNNCYRIFFLPRPIMMHPPFPIVVSRYNKKYHRSGTNPMSTQSNIENSSIIPRPSQQTRLSTETMTSYEKEHYKKALKEIYDTVKLRTQRLGTDSGSDRDVQSQGI